KGCFLCIGPNDQPVAKQERQLWTYGAVSFAQAVIDHPIRLRFESASGNVSDAGCYAGLRIAAGRLIAGQRPGNVLAAYDEVSQAWKKAAGVADASTVQISILPAAPTLPAGGEPVVRN
ncbi:MAG TPA: hypothetical protein VMF30_03025, partial [Pirellulales bacterium]|nr:hypothetical protein [Pirellulales bacterium]